MVGDKFGLGAYDFRKTGLVRSCDPSMQLLAVGPKQTGIRNILHQRMFKDILRIRWRASPEEQLSANKLLQGITQLALWHPRRSVQQLVRELAAQRGTDLGHLSHRTLSVKPCHQRVMERRGDRYRCQRTVKHIVMLPFPQQPAFEHCFGQLLDEEWHAVGANKDLVGHLVGQGSSLGDPGYQRCSLASAQSRKRDRCQMSVTRPGRRKLRPRTNEQ